MRRSSHRPASVCRGTICSGAPTRSPPVCSRSAYSAATASASGRRTASNGCSSSSAARASARSWSTSILPIAPSELEHALNKVECRVLVLARRMKSSDYVDDAADRSRPSSTMTRARRSRCACRASRTCEHVVAASATGRCRGLLGFTGLDPLAGPGHRSRLRELERSARSRRCDQHPVHQRHDRLAQRRDALPLQRRQQCALYREIDARSPPRSAVHSGAALSLLRHGARRAGCTAVGATMVFPGESFDAEATLCAVESYRCTALHGVPTMFIAQLEHPNFASYDLSYAPHRHHGGRAVPGRDDAPRIAAHAYERGHHRLRHDGNQSDLVPVATDDPLERRCRTVGRVQPHLEVKIVDAAGDRAARSSRRTVYARLQRDARLLGRSRTHARVDRRLRLDAQRRSRDASMRRAIATSSAA